MHKYFKIQSTVNIYVYNIWQKVIFKQVGMDLNRRSVKVPILLHVCKTFRDVINLTEAGLCFKKQ